MTVHGMHREASIDIKASKVGDCYIGRKRAGECSWSGPVMVTVAELGRCFELVTRPDEGPYVRWTYRGNLRRTPV
jgi:hypothetical protein